MGVGGHRWTEKGEAIPVMGAFGRPLAADTHLDEDACPGNIDQESGPGDRTMLNVHHLPPYGQVFQPFLAIQYQDCRSSVVC